MPIFSTVQRVKKQRRLNNIQDLQFRKLSHPVRHCFIPVQSERAGTDCVRAQTTKRGSSFEVPRAKLKFCFRYLSDPVSCAPVERLPGPARAAPPAISSPPLPFPSVSRRTSRL